MVGLKCHIPFHQGQIPPHLPDTMFNFTLHQHYTFQRAASITFTKNESIRMWLRTSPIALTYNKLHKRKVNALLVRTDIHLLLSGVRSYLLQRTLTKMFLNGIILCKIFVQLNEIKTNDHILPESLRQKRLNHQ